MSLRETRIEKALLYLEPGPLALVTTSEAGKDNVMTISWTMPLDFDGYFAMATGPWNYSFKALKKTRECAVCIPPASMLETAAKIGSVSGADCDKFALFGLNAIASKTISAPVHRRLHCLHRVKSRQVHAVGGNICAKGNPPNFRLARARQAHYPRPRRRHFHGRRPNFQLPQNNQRQTSARALSPDCAPWKAAQFLKA